MKILPLWMFLLIFSVSCDHGTQPEEQTYELEYIGAATMEDDGTIVMQLVVEDGQGTIGDLVLTIPPLDPEYEEVLDHLGGLSVGESKFVPAYTNP